MTGRRRARRPQPVRRRHAPWAGDRGSVTAEFAVVLPAVLMVVLLSAGVIGSGARHVRLQDAAADAARLIARGESADRAAAVVGLAGGTAAVEHRGDLVCVAASAPVPLPLPVPPLRAEACALAGGL